jgi:hypothetical protein
MFMMRCQVSASPLLIRGDSKDKESHEISSLLLEESAELPDEKLAKSQNAARKLTEMIFNFYVSIA